MGVTTVHMALRAVLGPKKKPDRAESATTDKKLVIMQYMYIVQRSFNIVYIIVIIVWLWLFCLKLLCHYYGYSV